jgi:hypothetical protein
MIKRSIESRQRSGTAPYRGRVHVAPLAALVLSVAADENQMTAQIYSDSTWSWGAWGPWEGGWDFGPGWGW